MVPGDRPATAMLAGLFDAGADDSRTRPLVGEHLAVDEPDARLSLVWQVPEDDEGDRRSRGELPAWAEEDPDDWDHAERGYAVVLLSGSPIWQEPVWYLDWGTGVGGYVANFQPVYGPREPGSPASVEGWTTSKWAIGLARLINDLLSNTDFRELDPTSRIVPEPSPAHPVERVP